MVNLLICRICLCTNRKGYQFNQCNLKLYYEDILSIKISNDDVLPQFICYECATLLHKYHKFKDKCKKGQEVLEQAIWDGNITSSIIENLDRKNQNLEFPLTICDRNEIINVVEDEISISLVKNEVKDTEESDILFPSDEAFNNDDNFIKEDIDDGFELDDEIPLIQIPQSPVVIANSADLDESEKSIPPKKKRKAVMKALTNFQLENNSANKYSVTKNKLIVNKQKNISERTLRGNSKLARVLRSKPNKYRCKKKESPLKKEKESDKKETLTERKKRDMNRSIVLEDTEKWKVINLTEEEAVAEFNMKADDPKYKNAVHKCVDCLKGFSKEDMQKRHIKLRHSESIGPIDCRFCHIRFKWASRMRRHLREHYLKYECLRCQSIFLHEGTALVHDDYHKGLVKKCAHCQEEFLHASTYYTHLRMVHRSQHVCGSCGASFVSEMGLLMHQKVKHMIHHGAPEPAQGPPAPEAYCQRCDMAFDSWRAFEEHEFHSVMHADGIDSAVAQSTDKPVTGEEEKTNTVKKISLKRRLDERQLTSIDTRKRKSLIRRRTKIPTTCYQCGKQFATQMAYTKHHVKEHPRTSATSYRHICEICGASLAPGSIAMHQNLHTRERLFSCDTCGRQFHHHTGLKRHLLVHTGEKPYGCTLCDKRFTQRGSMKLHYKTFHLKLPYPKRNRYKKSEEIFPMTIQLTLPIN